MTKKEHLKEVAKYHEDWIGIAKSYVGDLAAEEVVSEMYSRVDRYIDEDTIRDDGSVNRGYMFLCIRSSAFEYLNKRKKYESMHKDIDGLDKHSGYLLNENSNMEGEEAYGRILRKLDNIIESWSWYDRTLFNLYKDTPMSLRTMASETGISWMSIHSTIKRLKDEIHQELFEDYEDYKNGDYELIK